ncbi:transcription factor RfeG [Colletotrichum eremochloae]|nr:transcription factor RfeG [Colletotrichum eremochloae]
MSRQSRGPPANSAPSAPSSGRSNEYFVPRDGIDREVITADICRYLGNDALVRPGHYENPQTGQVVQGYYITAYRNLTTAMIDDLKADSARWEAERRQQAARNTSGGTLVSRDVAAPLSIRSNSPTAGYRQSETHSARQHYGPTDSTGYPDVGRDSYDSAPRYPGSQAPGYSGNSAQGYQGSPAGYAQQPSSFPSSGGGYPSYPGGSYAQQDPRDPRYAGQMAQGYGEPPYMATAANLARSSYSADPYGAGQPSRTPTTMAPQQGQTYSSGSQVPSGYSSGFYPPSTSAPYGSAPVASDPLYGRASPAGGPSISGQGSQYDQPPVPRTSATPTNAKAQVSSSGSSHSRRERESDRSHHQSDRHRPPRR